MSPLKPVSLNLNVRGMGLSATLAIKQKCRELQQQGLNIYDFGLGQSPFPVPPSVVEALRSAATERDYLPVQGLPALREAVADYHRRTDGIEIHPDDVLVGPGSKELMFQVQLVFYGEVILIPPCWVTYWPQARILGRRLSRIHATWESNWKIDAARLFEAVQRVGDDHRPRLLVLNYPSNPTGDTYSADELREIAEVARRFQIIVLSDEIYGQLHFTNEHVSIARFYPEGTIVSSGLSKWCGAGGWRLGTFSFPRELSWLAKAMATVSSETFTSVCAPIQHAAIRAFQGGPDIEQYLRHARRVLSALGDYCARTLAAAGLNVRRPRGAFYLFPDFTPLAAKLAARGITDGKTLCDRLLDEAGVAVLPGSAFGRSRGELTARLSYVDFDGATALQASEGTPSEAGEATPREAGEATPREASEDTLREAGETTPCEAPLTEAFLRRHCDRVVTGIDKLAAWVQA
ncbi:MAG TPA: aminotransferase class I/II-fold pyridoxal phosphate-dependent enzyme [Phycisphaerae bacterium]|nr:aminotransferase class I/II-fold pyridoxal phosphate-dependent enzyme [Phycisphaerae bacterium]HPC22394.1 aminotransferase class I/II-fold pyridoxal phosphate-dependent enzyme [Phycisphaerae bacterium]HRS29055.1 aminotransferase class I/II-fold pyridoxal phosphate-dependent enzyme [Phycisphaerae bacterium]HRT42957.1 aminotransferase class I/II-fold pyridoxal phosphate-dependent enzyme [Phycisphaerae bacterium]